jgi:hypothetical protein
MERQMKIFGLIVVLLVCVSSINAVGKVDDNDKIKQKKFFDFTNFVFNTLEDIIHKNVISNLNDDCLNQLRKLAESIEKDDDWALAGITNYNHFIFIY